MSIIALQVVNDRMEDGGTVSNRCMAADTAFDAAHDLDDEQYHIGTDGVDIPSFCAVYSR